MIKPLLFCLLILFVTAKQKYKLGKTNPIFLNETYHSGYLPIENRGKYFYWLFDSRNEPSSDPLIIWLEGGPGCSSLVDLFWENGPLKIKSDNKTLKSNPLSWNNNANLMYVDEPLDVGFSVGSPLVKNMDRVGVDFYIFMKEFLEAFPQFKGRDLYIAGQSYAGHYVPAIARVIVEKGDLDINLKGIAIGNGLFSRFYQMPAYATYGYYHNLMNKTVYNIMKGEMEYCRKLLKAGNWNAASQNYEYGCWQTLNTYMTPDVLPNVYDIRKDAPYDTSFVANFLNLPQVQAALGVKNITWEQCKFSIFESLQWADYVSMTNEVSYLLRNDLKVLIYYGVEDYLCNWMGGENFANNLDWDGKCKFDNLKYTQWKSYGEYKQLDNLVFLKIKGAGHMVPYDQPVASLVMIERFLAGW